MVLRRVFSPLCFAFCVQSRLVSSRIVLFSIAQLCSSGSRGDIPHSPFPTLPLPSGRAINNRHPASVFRSIVSSRIRTLFGSIAFLPSTFELTRGQSVCDLIPFLSQPWSTGGIMTLNTMMARVPVLSSMTST